MLKDWQDQYCKNGYLAKSNLLNENEAATYPNLWDTMKAFLRGKLIALSASKKKIERAHISSLTAHLKG